MFIKEIAWWKIYNMKAMEEHNKIFEELMRDMCHELREINVVIKKVEADHQD